MQIKVETFDLAVDKLESEKIVSFFAKGREDWLRNHILWAMANGRGVQLSRAKFEKVD